MPAAMPPLIEPTDDGGLRLHCPAKINLALSVGSPRADGLHPIASWMMPIAFGDSLTLRRAGRGDGAVRVCFADDAPRPGVVDWPIERDLAVRAWRAVEAEVGRALPIEAEVQKRVPTGAGLGGGSADAAGMLDGLDRLFGLGLSDDRLRSLAAGLGSDVVYQFMARRRPAGAVVTGTGDQIELLPRREPAPLLLVLPAFGCATAAVYAAFDERRAGHATEPDTPAVVARATTRRLSGDDLSNDLTGAACAVQPGLLDVLDAARAAGFAPHVTGSGAAVFVLCDASEPGALDTCRKALAQATGCDIVATWTAG